MYKVLYTEMLSFFQDDDKSAGPVATAIGSHAREPAQNLYRLSVIVVAQSLSLCRPSRRHLYHRHHSLPALPLPLLPLTVFVRASSCVCACACILLHAACDRVSRSFGRARVRLY